MLANKTGVALVGLVLFGAIAAPVVAPHATGDRFPDLLNAPPTRLHVVDPDGSWRRHLLALRNQRWLEDFEEEAVRLVG